MRILLLATNTEVEPYPVFPLGMAVVAAALEKAGHTVKQWDILFSGSPASVLEEFRPHAVAISIRNIDNVDSLTPDSHWALDAVRGHIAEIRQYFSGPVILGGPAFSLMPQLILDYCAADYGIVGEGEQAFPLLLESLEKGQVAERIWRPEQKLSGSGMLSAAYEQGMLANYMEASGVICLQTKRGCPRRCVYCSYPKLEGPKVRARNAEEVVDDILRLQSLHPVHELFFADSVFNDHAGHWLDLLECMMRRKVNVPWTGFFQPDGLDKEKLALCKASGLKALEFGTDACSDKTLEGMGKGFGFDTVEHATRLCNELRIPCAHFVIVGGPEEREETLREGLANLERLQHCVVFPYLGVRILPGTPLFYRAVEEGRIKSEEDCLRPVYYFSSHLSSERASDMILQSFKGNRLRVYPPSRGQDKIQALRMLGHKGILWDTLIRFDR